MKKFSTKILILLGVLLFLGAKNASAQTTVTVFEKNYAQLGYENFSSFQKMTEANPYRVYNSTRYNPFYYSSQNIINPNLVLLTMSQTTYLGPYSSNEGLTIFTGIIGLADLMVGDIVEILVGPDYKITPVEGLSNAVASANEILKLTKSGGTKDYTVTPYTMTVTKSGTVYFRGANLGEAYTSCPIASITVTRTLNGQDTFIGNALNGNYGSGLPIAANSTTTTTTTTCNFGFENVMSLNLTASGDAYFQNPNIQMSISGNMVITDYNGLIELNGTYYMPVYMAPGTYTITNNNVKSATLWAYSKNKATVTFKGADSPYELPANADEAAAYDITNYTEFTVGAGGMYGIFYLSNEPNIVTVGKILDREWTPELAVGTASNNPFADILTYVQTSSNTNINLGLTVTLEPVFTTQTEPNSWSEELAMPEWLWNQMRAIETTSTKKIDGYYYTPTTPEISEFKSVNGGSDMHASITNYSFPCSGKYKLTITSNNENVVIENGEQVFEVYPSTNLTYQYTLNDKAYNEGINISGYTVATDGNMIIDENLTVQQLQNLTLYIPGVYVEAVNSEEESNSHIYYLLSDDSTLSDDISLANFTVLDEVHNISLAELTDTKKYLYVLLAKNQATTPLSEVKAFIINRGNVPTGVEGINTEVQGEAVYYNMQGVKVQNPQHGIYVKVVNGKATKVVL